MVVKRYTFHKSYLSKQVLKLLTTNHSNGTIKAEMIIIETIIHYKVFLNIFDFKSVSFSKGNL